ncbi:MAG TPA: SCO family protein [Planctomycetaceae bacterium]
MTDPAPATRSRSLSLFLWASGAALWLVVGLLVVLNYVRGQNSALVVEEGKERPARTAVAVQAAGSDEAGGLVEPASIWSEEGIGDFSLTERSGETVTKEGLLGKPWIVGFVFVRCAGPCPKVTGQMRKLQDELRDEDVRLVTMTVDPDYDTPEVLTQYADAFGADEKKWLFLTGDKATMYRYIEEHFKMPVEETTGPDRKPGFEVIHTTNLLLVDAKGVVHGKYNALMPEEMAKLRRDVKKLGE